MSGVNSDNGIQSLGASAAHRCTLALVVCALLVLSWRAAPDAGAAITAADDAVSTEINTAAGFDVLANDGTGLTVVDHSQVSHGELSDNDDGVFNYLPHANFTGPDAFTYTVEDDSGARATATVVITVSGDITAVEARDDNVTTDEDVPVWLSLRVNDGAGPDNLPLTYSIEASPTHGEAALEVDGSLSYAPASNWSGSDELTYTVTDGVSTDTAIFSIEVISLADTPDAVDDAILTDQGHAVEIEILANDSEADGDEFWFVEHSAPLNGTVRWSNGDRMMTYEPNPDVFGVDSFTYTIADDNGPDTATVTVTIDGTPTANDDVFDASQAVSASFDVLANDTDPEAQGLSVVSVTKPPHGDATINLDFSIRYVPADGHTGADEFSYTVADLRGNQASATVTVNVSPAGNLAPVAGDDEFILAEDSPGNTLDVLTNDSDPDDNPLTIWIDRSPEFGEVIVGANQVVIYTPDPDFSGTDSFLYSISDGSAGTDSATVTVIVQAVNDQPMPSADDFTVEEDSETILPVLGNDADGDGDVLVVETVEDPGSGTATISESGELIYQPDEDYAGQDSFAYTVTDGHGGTAAATVTITITPVNDNPALEDDRATTDIDAPVDIQVLANDVDPDDASLGIAIVTPPGNGTAVTTAGGAVRYVPSSGFEGIDRFTYQVVDFGGASATATVIIIVGDPNLDPTAVKDDARTTTGKPIRIAVLDNDTSPIDSDLTVAETVAPEHGSVKIGKGGTIVYTPTEGYVGKDSFTYTVIDAEGRTDKTRVYLNVRADD